MEPENQGSVRLGFKVLGRLVLSLAALGSSGRLKCPVAAAGLVVFVCVVLHAGNRRLGEVPLSVAACIFSMSSVSCYGAVCYLKLLFVQRHSLRFYFFHLFYSSASTRPLFIDRLACVEHLDLSVYLLQHPPAPPLVPQHTAATSAAPKVPALNVHPASPLCETSCLDSLRAPSRTAISIFYTYCTFRASVFCFRLVFALALVRSLPLCGIPLAKRSDKRAPSTPHQRTLSPDL